MNKFIRTPMGLDVYLYNGEVSEVEDTDLMVPFSDIAGLPGIKPHPQATQYGVGYGSLVACNDAGQQLAYWESGSWH